MISIIDITRTYHVGDSDVHALNGVSFDISDGEHVSIIGPSGSGKSTLLHIIGCLDKPTSGRYLLGGQDTGKLEERERSRLRRDKIGFVFQFFHLLPRLTARKNIELPMLFAGIPPEERKEKALDALRAVGIEKRQAHRPEQLSGGERQRVAIARAVVMNPSVILADEPTGNLDKHAAEDVMKLLESMNSRGLTLVVVTHDPEVAERAGRIIRMSDGELVADSRPEESSRS